MSKATIIVNEPGERMRFINLTDTVSIGREHDNNVRVRRDEHVSKYHAIIKHRNGDFWIEDIGSTNGTTVNDEPVTKPRLLKDSDLICLGGASTLEFHLGSSKKNENIRTEVGDTPLPEPPKTNVTTTKENTALPVPTPPKPDFPLGAVLGVLGILSVGGVLAILYATGVIGGPRESPENLNHATPAPTQISVNQPPEVRVTPEPTATPAVLVVDPISPAPDPNDPPDGDTDSALVRQFAQNLAGQITGKNIYVFDANFVTLISRRLDNYRAGGGYHARAQKYVQPISVHLGSRGSTQLVAYVMAMSQTKFVPKGAGGVWFTSLPQAVVREAGGDTTDIDRVALTHLVARLDNFKRDDFIYAVACYGMSGDETGKFIQALQNADPEEKDRYDFWKMKNKRVVNGEQVEMVARFFAAGIVAENPGHFKLRDEQLSKLMN